MQEFDKFIIGFILVLVAMGITLGFCKTYNERIKIYIENGYTQKSLPGIDGTRWVKE